MDFWRNWFVRNQSDSVKTPASLYYYSNCKCRAQFMKKHFKGQDFADLWKQQTQQPDNGVLQLLLNLSKFQGVTQTWKNFYTSRPNLQTDIISLPPSSPLWADICCFILCIETQPTKSNSLVRCFSNGSPKCRSLALDGKRKRGTIPSA